MPAKIDYSGTWVTTQPSDPNRGAIMCINHAQFWGDWLLPLLQVINLGTQAQAATPVFKPFDVAGCTAGPNFFASYCSAHPDHTDPYYKFVPSGDGKSWSWNADSSLLSNTNAFDNGGVRWTLNQTGKWLRYKKNPLVCLGLPANDLGGKSPLGQQ